MSKPAWAEILKQRRWAGFLHEVNLLLALYKSGRKHYLKKEEGIIDLTIKFLTQAIQGHHDRLEAQKTGKITLTKKALEAEEAYAVVLIGLKDDDDIETLLPKFIETLKKTKASDNIKPAKIDDVISFFKAIAFKIEKNILTYQEGPAPLSRVSTKNAVS